MLTIILGFFGGLGIFLYGTHLLGNGLQKVGVSKMRESLAIITNTKIKGLLSGIIVTFFLQSSTVTNIIVVGLVGETLLTLSQAFGIVLGSAIGTTFTVQILTFDIAQYASIFIFLGATFMMFLKRNSWKIFGQVMLSIGFVFFGIGIITSSLEPIGENHEVLNYLINISERPYLFALIGLVLTALMHSSAAMIIIGIAFVSSDVLSIYAVLPLILGANVGDTLPVLISSLASQSEGKKLAVFNFLFKGIGATIILIILPHISTVVDYLPGSPERQIAHFHTLLNIAIAILFFPFITKIARLFHKLLPKKEAIGNIFEVKLNKQLLTIPDEALISTKKEVVKLGKMIKTEMINRLNEYIKGNVSKEELEEIEEIIDNSYIKIQKYLLKLGQANLTEAQSIEEVKLLNVLNDMEHVGDVVVRFVNKAEKINEKNISLNAVDQEHIGKLTNYVEEVFNTSLKAFEEDDIKLARKNIQDMSTLSKFEKDAKFEHFNNLIYKQINNPNISAVYLDVFNQLIQVYNHSQNISRSVLGLM